MNALSIEFNYYKSNQESIVAGHIDEYVVIQGTSVLGYYSNEDDAFVAMKGNTPGTFMVHLCKPKDYDDAIHYYGYWSEVA